jgi:hypothetical protein
VTVLGRALFAPDEGNEGLDAITSQFAPERGDDRTFGIRRETVATDPFDGRGGVGI